MKRHYFVTDDLDDLQQVEQDLQSAGITPPQFHVLSEDDTAVEIRKLKEVEAVLKKDVVHGTELGALVGIGGAAAVLAVAWFSGLTQTYTWVPAIFLAIVVLGFCTWEGGLIGIQRPHIDFKRFKPALDRGKHVLLVDVDPDQERALGSVVAHHSSLRPAGVGSATPRSVVRFQDKWNRFMQLAP